MNLALQVGAFIGIFHHLAVRAQLDHNRGGTDITAFLDCLVGRQERFVLHQLETAGMINQRITGNTGLGMVRSGETAVDNQQLAVCLDRVSPWMERTGT